jgi:hypothetical protein
MRRDLLPLDTWIVVKHLPRDGVVLASRHESQHEAEAERDKRNHKARGACYSACMLLEPIAQRMGGHLHPVRGVVNIAD